MRNLSCCAKRQDLYKLNNEGNPECITQSKFIKYLPDFLSNFIKYFDKEKNIIQQFFNKRSNSGGDNKSLCESVEIFTNSCKTKIEGGGYFTFSELKNHNKVFDKIKKLGGEQTKINIMYRNLGLLHENGFLKGFDNKVVNDLFECQDIDAFIEKSTDYLVDQRIKKITGGQNSDKYNDLTKNKNFESGLKGVLKMVYSTTQSLRSITIYLECLLLDDIQNMDSGYSLRLYGGISTLKEHNMLDNGKVINCLKDFIVKTANSGRSKEAINDMIRALIELEENDLLNESNFKKIYDHKDGSGNRKSHEAKRIVCRDILEKNGVDENHIEIFISRVCCYQNAKDPKELAEELVAELANSQNPDKTVEDFCNGIHFLKNGSN